ncbi:hypothetical protein [Kribbella sp. NPDC055071]
MAQTEEVVELSAPGLEPRRVGLLTSTVVGPLGLLMTHLLFAVMTLHGTSDQTGADIMALAAAHPAAARYATLSAIVGSLFMVPAAMAATRVIGSRSARLGFFSGTLVAAGYICYFGISVYNTVILKLAEDGGTVPDFTRVLNATNGDGLAFSWISSLFTVGTIVGTFLLGIALLRSAVIPTVVGGFIAAWSPLHIIGLFVLGNEWPDVLGGVLQLVGFVAIGSRVLRK